MDDVRRVMAETDARFGRAGVLANAAEPTGRGNLLSTSPDLFRPDVRRGAGGAAGGVTPVDPGRSCPRFATARRIAGASAEEYARGGAPEFRS